MKEITEEKREDAVRRPPFFTLKRKIIAICLSVCIVCLAVFLPLGLTGAFDTVPKKVPQKKTENSFPVDYTFQKYEMSATMVKGQYATFTLEYNEQKYVIEVYLLSDYAPKTVENFVKYAKDGAYNNTVFYRSEIEKNEKTGEPTKALLQGGTYAENNGQLYKKQPGKYYGTIEGEFVANGFTQNNVTHTSGILSMARPTADYNSADTEYFFMPYGSSEFDGYYAAFGFIINSEDITDLYQLTEAMVKTGKRIRVKSVAISEKK